MPVHVATDGSYDPEVQIRSDKSNTKCSSDTMMHLAIFVMAEAREVATHVTYYIQCDFPNAITLETIHVGYITI